MTVDEIYDLVNRHQQGGALHLDSSVFGDRAKRAIDTYFDDKALDLGAVAIAKEGNAVVARGISSHRPFNALGVTARFFDANGSLAANLAATLNGNYSFGDAFPPLASTFLGRATASDGALELKTPAGDAPAEISGALSAAYGSVPLGRGFFRANGKGGYLAGFAAPATFSPKELWSVLGPLFDILEFTDSGIIYSTIEAKRADFTELQRANVPETLRPGVTFFTSLKLTGVLQLLSVLFGGSRTLNLRGLIDLEAPASSTIQASIPGAIDLVALRFEDLVLNLRPGVQSFDLGAKAVLSFGTGANVSLKGTGTVSRTSATMQITVEEWKNALGIPHFDISGFGLGIGVGTTGTTAKFLGHFSIGAGGKFGFKLGGQLENFARPSALIFELDRRDAANPLKLSDIIESFTTLDLSSVPLIRDIAFRELAFYAIADPSGQWTAPITKAGEPAQVFHNGIGLSADLRFFSWDLRGKLQVGEKGIQASGGIEQGIDLLGILKIHAYGDTAKGPSFQIDTSKIQRLEARSAPRLLAADDAYFAFDGAIDLLGLVSQQFKGSARDDGFNVYFTSSLAGLFTTEFHAAYKKGESFAGSAKGGFDLRIDLPALKVAGVTVLPAVKLEGPTASLAIGVAVSKTEAKLDLRLQFSWLGAGFDIGFTLDAMKIANLLANLWDEIKKWILDNLETFYGPILETAEKFIEAVKKGAIWVADQAKELAAALKGYFNCAADEVSKFLTDVGYAVEDVARAVADAFQVAYEEAARIVNEAVKACGAGMARGFIAQ